MLCHKVANGPRGVTETKRKHCWGAPYEVFRREGFPSGEPRHVVGVREGEAAWVLPRCLGSQGDAELALKPLVVEELVVSRGAGPRCMQLHLRNHRVDCVEADGGERFDGSVSQCQLSSYCDDEV